MKLFIVVTVYLAIVNLIAFCLFWTDKRRAEKDAWRTPEKTLVLLAIIGGALGAFIGMKAFHHKTRKLKFRILVPLFMVLWIIVYLFLLALTLYSLNYYQADQRAQEALAATDQVEVTQSGDIYYFDGPGTESALVFYPGGKVATEAYAPLMQALAQEGVDCFLVDMPYHLAVFGINKAERIMASHDYVSWYVGGHSLGGAMAASFASDHLDELDGLVLLAAYPTADLHAEGFTTVLAYGTQDGVLSFDKLEEGRPYLPDETHEVIIDGGNHAQFGDYGPQAGDGNATISTEEQQAQTVAALIEAL